MQAYRRRVWLDELFGDLKGHGFDLEASHLRHRERLSRLTLAVVLLYDWWVSRTCRERPEMEGLRRRLRWWRMVVSSELI